MGFYHHSRLIRYRSPQGAMPCGQQVHLVLDLADGIWVRDVLLHTWSEAQGEQVHSMYLADGKASFDLRIQDTPGLIYYYFTIVYPDGEVHYYGGTSGEGSLFDYDPPSFRITVYDGAYTTPEWFCEGVCYQIFPDRFKRSSWEDFHARIACHTEFGESLRIHEQWSEPVLTSPAPGKEEYEPDDFYGGDLKGIISKLDYIASFGVTCIYLNPVFCSCSNHRYNTADYMHIDPLLGTDDDLKQLTAEAKKRGIRIMLDGVFSHTGSDSLYFNLEGKYGPHSGAFRDPDSPYREWYSFNEDGTYECWWGFKTLPNVKELTPSYVDFITGEHGVLRHWFDYGIRDWRLDVADELPDEFIRLLRKRIKEDASDGVILGEVWDEPTEKRGPEGRRGYVNGDELDSVMNYSFTNAVIDFLCKRKNAFEFADILQFLREQYPAPFYLAALNLMGSHDVVRASTALGGAPSRDEITREDAEKFHLSEADAEKGRLRLLLASTLQVILPGVPCLYYGDEAGLTGMADPFNRATYPWGREDKDLLEQMRAIFCVRKSCSAARKGKCRMGALSDDVFCVFRYSDDSAVLACVNSGNSDFSFGLETNSFPEGPDGEEALPVEGVYQNVVTGEKVALQSGKCICIPPLSYLILTRGK